jgi:2-methylcitrate dehydratase PrpD/predicted RNA-binding protein with PIN domain
VTRWLVDGMNVIGSRPTGWWRDRPRAMRELVEELRAFAAATGEPVTVVFDGRPFALPGDPTLRGDGGGVEVTFASRRGRNAADDDIAALVAQAEDPEQLRVVTSDSALAGRVRERGAEVVGAGAFRARLDEAAAAREHAAAGESAAPGARRAAAGRAPAGGRREEAAAGRPDAPVDPRYATAVLDWLACAVRGRGEPAARAAAALGDPVAAAATAGHVLDFDDTYLPGIAHLSAPTAPVALVLGAELGSTIGEVLRASAAGFEAMGALARASHPALYDHGFHPTAVCGGVGAAVAAAWLLGVDDERRDSAVAIALLGAAGLRTAFGSDGKALQVGFAAASGLRAARLAEAGARVPLEAAARGFEQATGGRFAEPDQSEPAVERNWIKAWPCCLQTHGAIEAADRVRDRQPRDLTVTVHPVSLQAASHGPDVEDGLQAKFSIPYLTAYTLLHGPPAVESFDAVDERARELGHQIEVRTDRELLESEAVLSASGQEIARVKAALGSPERPMDGQTLSAKVKGLAGDRLDGALDDADRPATELLALAGLAS